MSVAILPRSRIRRIIVSSSGCSNEFPAADRNNSCTKVGQAVDPAQHEIERNWFRGAVEFIAIGASKIASADWNNVRDDGMMARRHCHRNDARLPHLKANGMHFASCMGEKTRGGSIIIPIDHLMILFVFLA